MLLYIHIPYCDSKCYYCSFNSYTDRFDSRKKYMLALDRQLQFDIEKFGIGAGDIESIFIGGGTPSTVAPELYRAIFNRLSPLIKGGAEITVEANPNSATYSWLKGMQTLGVNRVSFGVQSFNRDKLKGLNRSHSPEQAIEAIENADRIGFRHISLDLIYNYQGDREELLLSDIDRAFSLPIDHISAYELTIEDGTKFSKTPNARQESEKLAFFVSNEIKKRGFKQYEVSNFGEYESYHNKGYWQLKNYMGVGAGAVGFIENIRYYPSQDIDSYIENPIYRDVEHLTKNELLTEKIFLGLRSSIGVDEAILSEEMRKRAEFLVEKGKLIKSDNRYKNLNYFLSDELALYIEN